MPVGADIPQEFDKALDAFRPHFGAPAFEHCKRYVLGLIVSENLTLEGINPIFVQARHPSSPNRSAASFALLALNFVTPWKWVARGHDHFVLQAWG
jgi:hypothetical protein